MIVEFIIAHTDNVQESCCAKVRQAWHEALEAKELDSFLPESEGMIIPQQWRDEFEVSDKTDTKSTRCILSFSLDTLDYTLSDDVIDIFIDNLKAEPLRAHVVRFEDPSFYVQLQVWFEEIFQLEMKLRRALTMVYLATSYSGDPYDLLHEEVVNPLPTKDAVEMEKHSENEFFHMLFSNYPSLNKRPVITLPILLQVIDRVTDFTKFKNEIKRPPVEKEEDAEFLADLKNNTDSIEKMRNCVAHYRRPSNKILGNYNNAKERLHQFLDDFLAQLAIAE
jgi:hypothetical protein